MPVEGAAARTAASDLLEIEVIMRAAAGIEAGAAGGALVVASHIPLDAQLGPASAAENGRLIPFGGWPDRRWVARQLVMAFPAGVVGLAAPHLDGDDVQRAVPVAAAGLGIERDAFNFGTHEIRRLRE